MNVATTVLGFVSHGVLQPLWNMLFSPLFMLSKVFQCQQGLLLQILHDNYRIKLALSLSSMHILKDILPLG